MPNLFLIPTVLAPGTAEQVLSPQIREVLTRNTYFFAENLRTARRFISELKTGHVIDELTFYELSKDTPPANTHRQLTELTQTNTDAGVLSEAGCPGVADPGSVAVSIAHELGWRVVPLVGPSSILLALMASGFSGQSFAFHGYLPIDKAERVSRVKALEKVAWQTGQTQLFMETPYRNNALFNDLLAHCQPGTRLCVAANLTAPDEFVQSHSITWWKSRKPDLHKKPTLFALARPES
jgi:16S rRNA (cytidine1402-2'-O)-methyltransferase